MIEKQPNHNAFLKGAFWLSLSTILLKIIGLIYKVPLAYMLGDEGMGYFNSAYTVYILFYIIGTSGIPKAISILVSKKEAESQFESYAIFKSAFKFFFAAGIVLLIIFLSSAQPFSESISNHKSILAMYAIAPSILFVCASGVIRGYLAGRLHFAPIAISELISGLCKLVFGLLLAYIGIESGKNLPTIAAYTILGITIGSLISLIYLTIVCIREPKPNFSNTPQLKSTIRNILKISIPITLGSAVGSIVSLLDLMLIMNGLRDNGFDITLANVLYGNYSTLAVPMLSLVSTLISPITTAMLPLLASSFVKAHGADYSKHLNTSISLTCLISVPAAILFASFSREVLSVIFEEGSAALSAPFLALLAPGVLLIGPLTAINTALEAAGKPTKSLSSLLIGAIAKLSVTIILFRYTDLGILCAPIGTSISYVASFVISCVYIRGQNAGILRSFITPFIASAISASATVFAVRCFDFSSSTRLFGVVCTMTFFILYASFVLLFSPKMRNALFEYGKMNKKRTKQL